MKRDLKDRMVMAAGRSRIQYLLRPSYETVSRRARDIWLGRGCPQGCDEAIWLEAEREVAQEMSQGMPPLEDRGVTVPTEDEDFAGRVDEALTHHPGRATTSIS